MLDLKLPTHRRGFLGSVAATAATLGLGELVPKPLEAQYDAAPTPAGAGDSAFEAWLNGIKGKHRQVYDAVEPNDGFALIWSHMFLLTGTPSYGVPETDLGVVVVLRHSAIPIAFSDATWAKYGFGEKFKITDKSSGYPAVRNVFANIKPGDLLFPEAAVEKLQARGVRFGVCNMAITFYSKMTAQAMGTEPAAVKQDWISGLLPGITVVTSGVVAVNGAWAYGCSYCYAW